MQDFSSKFFFVHTWDDTAMVQNVLKEVEHELNVKLTSEINATQSFVLTDEVYKKIEDAEFVIVFISKSSATCEYFAGCVTRSLHLNKSILPLEIEKLGLFNNSMKEFNFRKKPYSFKITNCTLFCFHFSHIVFTSDRGIKNIHKGETTI